MRMSKKPLLKLLLVLLALCCVGALWTAIAKMLPEHSQSGLEVQEKLTVSSAPIDKDGSSFSCLLSGSLSNPTDSTVTVKSLLVTVGDGEREQEIRLPGFSVPARTDAPVSFSWEDSVKWTQIQSVFAEYDEGGERLSNAARQGLSVNVAAVEWLVVAAALGYVTFSFGRVLHYAAQEDAMKKKSEEETEH